MISRAARAAMALGAGKDAENIKERAVCFM